jgi:citrate synthase
MEDIIKIFNETEKYNEIPNELYSKYGVKKGLRNEDGTGVLIGLTKICDVVGYKIIDSKKIDEEGQLYLRGYKISDICENVSSNFAYEEVAYLVLFGKLPNLEQLNMFKKILAKNYQLPDGFIAQYILRYPSMNVMNKIQRALLMLYSEDENADNTTVENTLKQGISILAKLTSIAVYAYQSKNHFFNEESLYIHQIDSSVSIAENILRLLRPNKKYLPEEVRILDILLVVHIDHGSGNNSTFVNSVIASTNTDIYSAFSASVGSLKGTKHGGANISCLRMMDTIIREIGLDANDDQIEDIINRILDKKFFDGSGLIYGMGHAVYTISDPRAMIIKHEALKLAKIKKQELRLEFYSRFENITKKVVMDRKKINICSNVDFYSGLVYGMLDIPEDLFTPLFVISRSCGWIAHNIENKLYANKIIRPAGRYVGDLYEYVKMEDRK